MTIGVGSTLGPFRLDEEIGRREQATLYKAFDTALDVYRAVKTLPLSLTQDPVFAARLQHEVIAANRLLHPNIIRIYDFGEDQGTTYLVMQYVDGGTIADRLGRPLALKEVRSLLAPIGAALDYAHAAGVLHRDVEPSNILLWRDGTPVLSDFGLVQRSDDTMPHEHIATSMRRPEYMAPEQVDGAREGPATDQYALAVVAYEMLTGRAPFTGSPSAVLKGHRQDSVPPPRALNPSLDPTAEAALLKALSKRQEDRFSTVTAFLEALGKSVQETVDATVPSSEPGHAGETIRPRQQLAKLLRPHRWIFLGFGAVSVVALATLMVARSASSVAPPFSTAEMNLKVMPQTPETETPLVSPSPKAPQLVASIATSLPTAEPTIIPTPVPTRVTGCVLAPHRLQDPDACRLQEASQEPDKVVFGYVGEEYHFKMLVPGMVAYHNAISTSTSDTFTDVTVAIEARLVGVTTSRYVYVSCREVDSGVDSSTSGSLYALLVYPGSGTFSFVKKVDGKRIPIILSRRLDTVQRDHAFNLIELACRGDTIAARINQRLVASEIDTGAHEGQVRIGVGNSSNGIEPTEASFRNVTLTLP